MSFAVPAWDLPSVPVAGSEDRYPVRRIYCIGRNYTEHAREMGADEREPPFFFLKPADAIVQNGTTIPYPVATSNFHYEGELVAVIGKAGSNISVDDANDHIFGYGVGLDMTRRDLQNEAKEMRRPWDMGKGFDQSAPCSEIYPASEVGHPASGALWLKVNGETKQQGDIADMIWNIPESVSYLSGLVRLEPGDLIMTGTPAGVGAVVSGDDIVVHVDGVCDLNIKIG
ncbi:MAG: fumarylacetoacetate hydrolase family protein [Rhodospirillaceae bacterium]|mgnify:CR=1 FL=1|jgi:fumarylpyruvate hydrolase|nr:fumarylacetoacetate hydrolase family protein [Rhodospirillaceae bacterium]MBT5457963.1 fumarylacetoacetate hydrolase family protein [Rhodospirillaceae bacterium]